MSKYVDQIEFQTVECCACHSPFAITTALYRERLDDHKTFYCPQGHPQHYSGKSEAEKLREEVERQKQMRDAEEARRLRVEKERDDVARAHNRMRSRVMNGVCPCCNRTFQNLLQHMKTEHAGELNLRTLRLAFGMTQRVLAEEIGVKSLYVSEHERGLRVPASAKRSIESWLDQQAARSTDRAAAQG